jgi:5S rRNA maturation endonuclease (ribonuclease M5)
MTGEEKIVVKENKIIKQIVYNYYNEGGELAYKRIRLDFADGSKKFVCEQPNGIKNLKGIKHFPYNLCNVINADTVYIVEGEKCADKLIELGYCATTLDNGSSSHWYSHFDDYFKDKAIIILIDNDKPGFKYGKILKEHLPNSKVILLNDLEEKEDVYDWLNKGHSMEEIANLPEFDIMSYFDNEVVSDEEAKTNCKKTQAEIVLSLVEENNAVLFHDTTNEPYISTVIDGHKEIWAIDSNKLNIWLNSLYYNETKKPLKKETIAQVISVLSAKAIFGNKKPIQLFNRVAINDNAFWYDLTNSDYQSITTDGWKLVNETPILFNRYRHQKAQIEPAVNGDINRIFDYVNIKNSKTLFICWLVTCFIPDIPHTMAVFHGEQGSAKSTTCKLLKALIDPSELETLTLNRNERSLIVNLQQHWFLPFDNVSYISEENSDTLCRAITGGGLQQRKLFTNTEDCIFKFKKCFAINGINNVATRPDLLDRSILIELSRITEQERKELVEVERNFEKDLPYILGGVFDVLSKAIRIYPTIKLDKLPRMADFTRWGYAIGEALGGFGETFVQEYLINIKKQDIEIINSNVIATLMIDFMKDKAEWSGLVSELYNSLVQLAPSLGINPKSKSFPAQSNVLSRRLTELKSVLFSAGISYEKVGKTNGTLITIKNKNIPSSLAEYKINFSEFGIMPNEENDKNVLYDDNEDVTF